MKIKLALFSLFLLVSPTTLIAPVFAQVDISSDICNNQAGNGEKPAICEDIEAGKNTNVIYGNNGILTRAISLLSIVVGVLAVVVIIYAGIKMSISRGDPGKITNSRDMIIYAVIGLLVAILAQAVVQLVLNRIGVN